MENFTHKTSIASIFGQAYEVFAKRGVLACLTENNMLDENLFQPASVLADWRTKNLNSIYLSVIKSCSLTDENLESLFKRVLEHMSILAFGNGFTVTREYLKNICKDFPGTQISDLTQYLDLDFLWCPLVVPDNENDNDSVKLTMEETARNFIRQFGDIASLSENGLRISGRGMPVNADFILFLKNKKNKIYTNNKEKYDSYKNGIYAEDGVGNGNIDKYKDYLLIQEYSYNTDFAGGIKDFNDEKAHLEEIMHYWAYINARSVFTNISAEVDGESFDLSNDISSYLSAFTSKDKPFYKLCQACSYAYNSVPVLRYFNKLDRGLLDITALALTPVGVESISSTCSEHDLSDVEFSAASQNYGDTGKNFTDFRQIKEGTNNKNYIKFQLMKKLGEAYRNIPEHKENNFEDEQSDDVELSIKKFLRNGIFNKLPKDLYNGIKEIGKLDEYIDNINNGQDLALEFSERLEGSSDYFSMSQLFTVEEAIKLLPEELTDDNYPNLSDLQPFSSIVDLPKTFREIITEQLNIINHKNNGVTLRDIHASLIKIILKYQKLGSVNILALEGNPGIGKTTALIDYLNSFEEGYLFIYASPRVVINRDVTQKIASFKNNLKKSVTLTSNSRLINSFDKLYAKNFTEKNRFLSGCVVADGMDEKTFKKPEGSILVISKEEEKEIENRYGGNKYKKNEIFEGDFKVNTRVKSGVIRCLANALKDIMSSNIDINRFVLSFALQGYRLTKNKKNGGSAQSSTVDALDQIFASNKSGSSAMREERMRFAERIPNIIVMADEITGSDSGSLFVKEILGWLKKQFADPFKPLNNVGNARNSGASKFKISLIISDASLNNENVLDKFLNSEETSPEKILISPSRGKRCIDLKIHDLRINMRTYKSIHVMANSFPAKNIEIDYKVKMSNIELNERKNKEGTGILDTKEQSINKNFRDKNLSICVDEIASAVKKNESNQIIFFAQDKNYLSDLKLQLLEYYKTKGLTDKNLLILNEDNVKILDSSVSAIERERLVSPNIRDATRVFLMTSSGGRGISFPKTDTIITLVPNFNIASSLMEIVQLIYRGRGAFTDENGQKVSGDDLDKKIIMLVNDYFIKNAYSDSLQQEENKQIMKRRWLRQSVDLITFIIMLRSSIFTRITGDSGLKQKISFVPVGRIENEYISDSLSDSVDIFLKESNRMIARNTNSDYFGVFKELIKNIESIFLNFRLESNCCSDDGAKSCASKEYAEKLLEKLSDPNILLLLKNKNSEGFFNIPDSMYFKGPLIIEDWSDFSSSENFVFNNANFNDAEDKIKKTLNLLKSVSIGANKKQLNLPHELLTAVEEIKYFLNTDEGNHLNSLGKKINSERIWVALPAAYLQFMIRRQELERSEDYPPRTFNQEEVSEPLRYGDLWLENLRQAFSKGNIVLPVMPKYAEFPWAACYGGADPTNFNIIFNDKYFNISNEVNLLNMLLLY
ncbi:MAG: hypothetical protein M1576_02730 [Deltaproteobacteria bacterium]|uniref:Helicase C-terminal domain-containing protein n=1 Tax=Acididesulfobacter guangdongensis TaxID=2597225 RepID=A0A519BIS7_ACIG2|nr:hypothetical protein [Deltaproteobacteria bacterium]RZD17165.1 MAG: hypothetical protein EVJ46_02750 [Candidatus Acididesulfobacter guangdongensis]